MNEWPGTGASTIGGAGATQVVLNRGTAGHQGSASEDDIDDILTEAWAGQKPISDFYGI